MANRTEETKAKRVLTPLQKGKRYALLTLILTGAYSTYANVRSGQIAAEPVITSIAPTFVFFLTVHLLSYFTPKSTFQKVLVYGGLGFVTLVAFGISGFHIWELTVRNGQMWYVAIFYPFIVDVPSAIATVILVQKVTTSKNNTSQAKTDNLTIPPIPPQKKATPRKAVPRVRTNTKPKISTESDIPVKSAV